MDKQFLLFDDYVLNVDENIIGFIRKDIYLELDREAIEMFNFLQEQCLLFSLSELRMKFELMDIDNLVSELSELGLFHEGGHYLAARLLNVNSTLNLSQRFIFFLVFECRMNGIWLLDRKLRIFPMLGGILMDNFIIFICSLMLQFFISGSTILFVVLFIQYTKMIYHLLIPFKTDLYYFILFYIHGMKKEQKIMSIFNVIGLIFLIPLIVIYFIQFKNLLIAMNNSSLFQVITVWVILLFPIFLFIRERRKND